MNYWAKIFLSFGGWSGIDSYVRVWMQWSNYFFFWYHVAVSMHTTIYFKLKCNFLGAFRLNISAVLALRRWGVWSTGIWEGTIIIVHMLLLSIFMCLWNMLLLQNLLTNLHNAATFFGSQRQPWEEKMQLLKAQNKDNWIIGQKIS